MTVKMVVPTLGSLLRKKVGLIFKFIFGQLSMHYSLTLTQQPE